MEPLVNFSNPMTIGLITILVALLILLSRKIQKSYIMGIVLVTFLVITVGHTVSFFMIPNIEKSIEKMYVSSILMDLVFVFLSFISYIWMDDIQAKKENKKVVMKSGLDWFWSKL